MSDNLIPFSELTESEQRKIASKGGKSSGKARRRKKLMREQIELLFSLPIQDENIKANLKKLGINPKNIDNQMAMIIALWKKSLRGDVSAATFLRDTVGEKPVEKVEMNASVNKVAKEIEDYVESKK